MTPLNRRLFNFYLSALSLVSGPVFGNHTNTVKNLILLSHYLKKGQFIFDDGSVF